MSWVNSACPEKEKAMLKKLIRKNPGNADAHYRLGGIYTHPSENLAKAKECCEKAINLEPKNIYFRALSAFINAKNGDDWNAIGGLVTLIELDAKEDDYYIELAIDTEYGMDNELVWCKVLELINSGREQTAKKLLDWLIHPSKHGLFNILERPSPEDMVNDEAYV